MIAIWKVERGTKADGNGQYDIVQFGYKLALHVGDVALGEGTHAQCHQDIFRSFDCSLGQERLT